MSLYPSNMALEEAWCGVAELCEKLPHDVVQLKGCTASGPDSGTSTHRACLCASNVLLPIFSHTRTMRGLSSMSESMWAPYFWPMPYRSTCKQYRRLVHSSM